ncbi:MAG: hypothetical protein LBL35_04705 [Clostridiales bacterium]|jgi:hypothetical protein|nr:hypothetical protein [Clostridiales bacterium]
MASIRRRGETYHITVSLGVDDNYKQIRKFTTFTPPHGLTEKQGLKAAQEYARVFELNCRGLTSFDENMTLSEPLRLVFQERSTETHTGTHHRGQSEVVFNNDEAMYVNEKQ